LNDAGTWKPSALPPGMAFEGDGPDKRAVPVVMPADRFFDDEPDPAQGSLADNAEILRAVCSLLDGPAKTTAVRVAALRRLAGVDRTPLRHAARKVSCSPATLLAAKKAIEQALKLNTFSEGNRRKN
jgi:hypothetical protein